VFGGVLTFQYAALIGPNDVPYASLPVLSRRCPSFFPAADMAAADQPPMGARTANPREAELLLLRLNEPLCAGLAAFRIRTLARDLRTPS